MPRTDVSRRSPQLQPGPVVLLACLLWCVPSFAQSTTGTFGTHDVSSPTVGAGFDPGVSTAATFLVDVDADQRADFCRIVSGPGVLSCGLATAAGTFGNQDVWASGLDLGYGDQPRFMADVDGDGRADYCRVVGDYPGVFFSCATATGTGTFGQYDVNSGAGHANFDLGYAGWPRFMVDVDADHRADFCRFVDYQGSTALACALATASGGFGNYDVVATHLDFGYGDQPRLMADVDGDGRADFCRVVGDYPGVFLSCATATGTGTFGQYDVNSAAGIDRGEPTLPRFLADVDGDGRADFCRFVGAAGARSLACALATATGGFGDREVESPSGIDAGTPGQFMGMADVDASGEAGYCRFLGAGDDRFLSCDLPAIDVPCPAGQIASGDYCLEPWPAVGLPADTPIAIRTTRVMRDYYGGSDVWTRFYGKVDGRFDAVDESLQARDVFRVETYADSCCAYSYPWYRLEAHDGTFVQLASGGRYQFTTSEDAAALFTRSKTWVGGSYVPQALALAGTYTWGQREEYTAQRNFHAICQSPFNVGGGPLENLTPVVSQWLSGSAPNYGCYGSGAHEFFLVHPR